MMRLFTGLTSLAMIAVLITGHAAVQGRAVPNRVPCDSLAGMTVPATAIGLPTTGATVAAADLVAASAQTVTSDRVVLALPEYCRVTGRIAPVDPAAPPINFHINLPSSWNRKLAQLGGSGSNGVIPVALTTGMHWGPESIPPNAPYALARGFVVYGSDSGHQTAGGRGAPAPPPAADWTANDEAFTNFAYAQMKKTHDVVVSLVARFYGEPIRRSYYLGSSQGGREALIVTQRFPQDYDGVFAQVPANTYVHLSIGEPLARAKAQAGDGWIPPAKVAAIGKEVLRQCDALDGLADGLVSNYMACDKRFNPSHGGSPLAAIRCDGGADTGETCLSDAQIRAASAIHGSMTYPFALANGWTAFSGWPTGSESSSNWKALPSRPTPASNFGVTRARVRNERTLEPAARPVRERLSPDEGCHDVARCRGRPAVTAGVIRTLLAAALLAGAAPRQTGPRNAVVVFETEKGAIETTARASFSVVIGDQPEMDFGGRRSPDGQGFAAFGRLVRGMDVVKAIQASPTGQRGDYGTESLDPPIRVLKAYRR